ncbi:MAG: N-acetylmuramoyl-L-alanine amidase, partial [Planctomycetota bacterium]
MDDKFDRNAHHTRVEGTTFRQANARAAMSRMTLSAMLLLALAGCAAQQPRTRPLPSPIINTGHAPPPPRVVARRPPPSSPPKPRLAPPPARKVYTPIHASFVVDPGHGGHDPGAKGVSPRPEKTITLEIARKLADALRDRASSVVMSRGDDTFISLNGRAALAERHRVDLFVSIHADSAPRAGASGATVY